MLEVGSFSIFVDRSLAMSTRRFDGVGTTKGNMTYWYLLVVLA